MGNENWEMKEDEVSAQLDVVSNSLRDSEILMLILELTALRLTALQLLLRGNS